MRFKNSMVAIGITFYITIIVSILLYPEKYNEWQYISELGSVVSSSGLNNMKSAVVFSVGCFLIGFFAVKGLYAIENVSIRITLGIFALGIIFVGVPNDTNIWKYDISILHTVGAFMTMFSLALVVLYMSRFNIFLATLVIGLVGGYTALSYIAYYNVMYMHRILQKVIFFTLFVMLTLNTYTEDAPKKKKLKRR